MKYKKAFAAVAALAMTLSVIAAPAPADGKSSFLNIGIVASAAKIGKVTQNGLTYELYDQIKADGVVKNNAAFVVGSEDTTGCITIPEGIYANGSYYKIYKISSKAFANNNMSGIDMHNAYSLFSIYKDAFYCCKNLTEVALPYNLSKDFDTRNTFLTCTSFKSFVDVPCANYKVIDGILYNKEATKLLVYPQAKTDFEFTMPATVEECIVGLNNNFDYVKNIKIADGLSDEQLEKNARVFFGILGSVRRNDILFNGEPVYTKDENNASEPVINPVLKEVFYEKFADCTTISNEYAKDYAAYIANTIPDENDSDLAKAVKLHDWLCGHVKYDPVVSYAISQGKDDDDKRNHCDASAFLHYVKADGGFYKEDGLYTVCDGYARAYKLLMNAAGISCERVHGEPTVKNGYGHAWNIFRLNDKDDDPTNDRYYYVDATWDSAPEVYTYFMKGGKEGTGNHGTSYKNWSLSSSDAFNVLPKEGDYLPNFGDADHDGRLSVNDYKAIKAIISDGGFDDNADVNADGQVDDEDADIMAKYILNKRGDTNADGVIDEADVRRITQSVGLNIFGTEYDVNLDGIADQADIDMVETMIGVKTQALPKIEKRLFNDILYHTAPEFASGDIDGSGFYNSADSLMLRGIVADEAEGIHDSYTEEQRARADINHDGKIDNADSELLNEYLNNSLNGDTISFCQFLLNKLMK